MVATSVAKGRLKEKTLQIGQAYLKERNAGHEHHSTVRRIGRGDGTHVLSVVKLRSQISEGHTIKR